jgi:hypothetical protein
LVGIRLRGLQWELQHQGLRLHLVKLRRNYHWLPSG